jgi:polysaccharide export outer membrane protein
MFIKMAVYFYCRLLRSNRNSIFCIISFFFMVLFVTACTTSPQLHLSKLTASQPDAIISSETKTLSNSQVSTLLATEDNASYYLGPDDVITVSVYLHPELSVPFQNNSGAINGALITGNGNIQLPMVGEIHVGGKTLGEAKQIITAAYQAYIKDPDITVQLVQAQSMRYYLLGAFTNPGVKYPIHPLALLDVLALAGSVDLSKADLYQAYVAKGMTKLPIDLHALLVEGDLTQNVILSPGDAVVIPSTSDESVYIMGAVSKPGAVKFEDGRLSLLQALGATGFDLTSYTESQLSNIHIIRSHGANAQYIVVDARAILNGQANPFTLQPGDVVFVPPTGVASWNQILNMALPSLQMISSVLNPFVQITYLSRHN